MLNDEPVRSAVFIEYMGPDEILQVYRTRTKTMTSTPFFNASTERFVKDWQAAHVCIVVRDSRMRETDPLVGMVFFKVLHCPP